MASVNHSDFVRKGGVVIKINTLYILYCCYSLDSVNYSGLVCKRGVVIKINTLYIENMIFIQDNGEDGIILVFDVSVDCTLVRKWLTAPTVVSLAVDNAAQRVVSGNASGQLTIWTILSQQPL